MRKMNQSDRVEQFKLIILEKMKERLRLLDIRLYRKKTHLEARLDI